SSGASPRGRAAHYCRSKSKVLGRLHRWCAGLGLKRISAHSPKSRGQMFGLAAILVISLCLPGVAVAHTTVFAQTAPQLVTYTYARTNISGSFTVPGFGPNLSGVNGGGAAVNTSSFTTPDGTVSRPTTYPNGTVAYGSMAVM